MKRFAWLVLLLLALLSFAAAENVSYVDIPFVAGTQNNLSYRFLIINGVNYIVSLQGIGDAITPCGPDFCAFPVGFFLVPVVSISDFEDPGGLLRFGGLEYDTSRGDVIHLLGLAEYSIVGSGFVFPAGGNTVSTFTETVDAHFASLDFGSSIIGRACSASSQLLDCTDFAFGVPDAKLTLTFTYYPDFKLYILEQGEYSNVPVPEPGSTGLIATCLVGVLGIMRRRCS